MHVGKILPLTVGSAGGRVLLAHGRAPLEEVATPPLVSYARSTGADPRLFLDLIQQARVEGYADTVGERGGAGASVSAPVFDPAAEIFGALTISGSRLRMPDERCREWTQLLVAAAEQVTRTLGGRCPR
nr:IclR family transcriptional regulator C-terminal domain-containing protein [Rhodococcus wratislaviensis]